MTIEYRLAFQTITPLSLERLSQDFYEEFDGVLTERSGQIVATVYVEGATAEAAARTAIEELEEKLDLSICHADPDLVDGPEIARRLDVTRQAVQFWATGKRGQGFPHPVGSPGGRRIWPWGDVVMWARTHQGSVEPPGLTRDELAFVDAHLADRRRQVSSPRWAIKPGHLKAQAGVKGVDDYLGSQMKVRANS